MKKSLLAIVAMFAMAISANAQYNVTGHRFFDNWSVGIDGGATTNLHDWDTPNGGVAGIQFTKGITPVFSIEFSSHVGFNNNANWNYNRSHNVVDNVNALATMKFNLMNLFGGYKGAPRVFELQARAGAGYMRHFYTSTDESIIEGLNGEKLGGFKENSSIFNFGLDFDFNLGQKKAWTLSVRPAVIMKGHKSGISCDNQDNAQFNGMLVPANPNVNGGCQKYGHNAVGQLTAGVTYHFKNSNGTHHFENIKPVVVTETVEKIVEVPVEKVVTKEVIKKVVGKLCVVEFDFDKDELTDATKAELDLVTAKSVNVVAYASNDGVNNEPVYNQKLAQRRANNIKAYLEAKGIKVTNAVGMGIVGNSKRVAVVSPND